MIYIQQLISYLINFSTNDLGRNLVKNIYIQKQKAMVKSSKEWLEKAVSDGHIEYDKFTDLAEIGSGGLKYDWIDYEKIIKDSTIEVYKLYIEPRIPDII